MKLFNASKSRTVTHEDNGNVITLLPGSLTEVDDDIAENILGNWKEVSTQGPAASNLPDVPWETKCGPQWELAQREFKIDLNKTQTTVGPDRPEVVETAPPSDAVDTETGKVNEKLLNIHACGYCPMEFSSIVKCRNHQRKEHKI